ncbi:MAG TPA: hypothetical protein VGY56_10760 [Verrucomicrobiae bacterium]|nr:hypothetical protein [Verrucomicrobiae bacterium]
MPDNDNFANATVIQPNYWLAGSNIGATREGGEPANNGGTIWWSFTPQDDGIYVVSTRTSDGMAVANKYGLVPPVGLPGQLQPQNAGVQWTDFYSKVQVFTANNPNAPAVNNLSEVGYTEVSGGHAYLGIQDDFADQVSFAAVGGTTYYIRVDSRKNDVTNRGNVCLSVYMCACSGGCPAMPGVGSLNVVAFGNYPPGNYTIKYCAGAFNFENRGGNNWATLNWTAGAGGGIPDKFGNSTGYYVIYNDGKAFARFNVPSAGFGTYPSALKAEADAQGATVTVAHTGGMLGIEFVDTDYSDNTSGTPSPTFYIAQGCANICPQDFSIESAEVTCVNGILALQVIATTPQAGFVQTPLELTVSNMVGFSTPATQSFAWGTTISGNIGAATYVWTLPINITGNPGNLLASLSIGVPHGAQCASQNFKQPFNWGLSENGCNFSQAGGTFTGVFNVLLDAAMSCANLSGCIVTLQATGGVVNPSGPLTGINFIAGDSTPLQFTFNGVLVGNVPITATLNITDGSGNQLAQMQWELGTGIVVSGNVTGEFTCPVGQGGGGNYRKANITVKNMGNVESYDVQLTAFDQCTNGNQTLDYGQIAPGASVTLPWTSLVLGTATIAVQEIAPNGQAINFPNFTI